MIYSKNSRPLLGIKKFNLVREHNSGWFKIGVDINLCDIPDNTEFILKCEHKYINANNKECTTIINYLCNKLKDNIFEIGQGSDLEESKDFKFKEIKIV